MSELDRLEAAMSECREMIREAHAATKDLRAAVREARQEARALTADEVAAQIRAEVSRQLEELGERTGEAVTAATRKVIAAVAEGDMLRTQLAILRRLAKHEPANTIAIGREIARHVIDAGRYAL